MPQSFDVLVDDQDPQIVYTCPSLKQRVAAGSYANNTWTSIKDSSCTEGWFSYKFKGTGIRIRVPTSKTVKSAAVLLDGQLFKPDERGLFESAKLLDGEHTFSYGIGEVSAIPVFDYLTVTASASTPLNGRTLIVDDRDTLIKYTGNWATEPSTPLALDYASSLHRDTAHWSSSVGDTVEFEFAGNSVAVYGLASNLASGNITATYTVDGDTKTRTVPEGTYDSVPMAQFFHADLAPGVHTLIVNVTEIAPAQRFALDFIAYNATDDSIVKLPGFEAQGSSNAAAGPDGAAGSSPNLGAILGGLFGALAVVAALGVAFFVWRRRRASRAVRLNSNNPSVDDLKSSQPQTTQVLNR